MFISLVLNRCSEDSPHRIPAPRLAYSARRSAALDVACWEVCWACREGTVAIARGRGSEGYSERQFDAALDAFRGEAGPGRHKALVIDR